MKPLIIFGAGGFGAEVAALVEEINAASATWSLRGFLDDDTALHGTDVLGYPVLGDATWLAGGHECDFVIAIGNPHARSRVSAILDQYDVDPVTLVHPTASVHASCSLGPGAIICRGVTITVRIVAGSYLIANLNTTVGHDTEIGSCTTLHPATNLSGNTILGDRVEIGTGAITIPGRRVGSGSIVGAGAVVTKDVPRDCVATGVPARVSRQLTEERATSHSLEL